MDSNGDNTYRPDNLGPAGRKAAANKRRISYNTDWFPVGAPPDAELVKGSNEVATTDITAQSHNFIRGWTAKIAERDNVWLTKSAVLGVGLTHMISFFPAFFLTLGTVFSGMEGSPNTLIFGLTAAAAAVIVSGGSLVTHNEMVKGLEDADKQLNPQTPFTQFGPITLNK